MATMGRPTKKVALSRKGTQAIDKIRDNLPRIVDELLEVGFKSDHPLSCPRCSHKFVIQVADPKTLQWLWERAEGKVPEQQTDTGLDKLSRLFENMAKAGLAIEAVPPPSNTLLELVDASPGPESGDEEESAGTDTGDVWPETARRPA
jgi:hypothetical protein